jgi:hypothetical protein
MDKAVKLGSALHKNGLSTKVVLISSYADSDNAKEEITVLHELANLTGLGDENLVLLHERIPNGRGSFSHHVVRDLLLMSDITIMASQEEAHNLCLIESSLCRNLLVLNEDFPPLKSIYQDGAVYARCSSVLQTTTYGQNNSLEDELGYWHDVSVHVIRELYGSTQWRNYHRQRFDNNPDRIFHRHLEPLILGCGA